MATEIIMPKAGIDMTEGQIIKWNKKEGEKVEEGEILLEIMTDKTSMELEAEASGYLIKIVKGDGETVPVTEIIGYIGAEGEAAPEAGSANTASAAPAQASQPKSENVAQPAPKKEKAEDEFDVVVIGGGPAGYVAAIRAAQLGAKVAVVEKNEFGGTCLNRGCIPTKTFLKNAEILEGIEMASKRGIILESEKYTIDMPKVVQLKNEIVKTLTNGVRGLLKSNEIKMFNGVGKINKDKDVVVNGETVLRADKIILAGGSKVGKINIPGIESNKVLTSDDILDIQQIPKSLTVIGGGVVGIELGQVFLSFGSEVTVVEMMDRIVPGVDRESSAVLRKELEKKGMKILTSTQIKEIVDDGHNLTIKVDGHDDIVSEKALLSIGRVPDLEAIGEIELEMEKGRIKVDKYMETSVPGIYAPGDINGIKMLAHAAFRMGEVAAENAVQGNHREIRLETTPSAIYTVPEVAMAGLTEEEAKAKYDIKVGKFQFAANGRALASGESAGFVKVIVDKKYDEILGVHIVGPSAAEMINEASGLMAMEITVDEVIKTIYAHPTYSEALFEACADALDEAIHLPRKRK
ncbi:dihydrolipoyl dehydrogenase [Leptotrichia hongkongensis]|mgnify:FL=1|uniref:Dihydrolipoyl dehydrogenase n=1 Tax=Leptotrichia hongkongensis TaxID=554406 RepID=A0ABV4S4S6_9FUSO